MTQTASCSAAYCMSKRSPHRYFSVRHGSIVSRWLWASCCHEARNWLYIKLLSKTVHVVCHAVYVKFHRIALEVSVHQHEKYPISKTLVGHSFQSVFSWPASCSKACTLSKEIRASQSYTTNNADVYLQQWSFLAYNIALLAEVRMYTLLWSTSCTKMLHTS